MNYICMRFPNFRQKVVTLSYDDGLKWDRDLISIMSKYGLKGTFNLNSGSFAGNPGERKLTAREAIELYTSTGNEVAVHGHKHLSLGVYPLSTGMYDVILDRIELEKLVGYTVRGMAYANGSFDDASVNMLPASGIVYARTTYSTEGFDLPQDWFRLHPTCHHNNPRLMELAREFTDAPIRPGWNGNVLRLFYLWGHSHEFDDRNNWHVIEEFASFIGNRDDIWYATNIEIYDYVKAYEALQFSASASFVHNPTATDVYINYRGAEILIPSGKTVSIG